MGVIYSFFLYQKILIVNKEDNYESGYVNAIT